MTTGEAIREFCKECVNSNLQKYREKCGGEYVMATKKPCALFKYRVKGKGTVKAIRKNCVECMGGSFSAVDECFTSDCHLYQFRLGKIPEREGHNKRLIRQNQFKPKSRATA
jgi:hypothetical protein